MILGGWLCLGEPVREVARGGCFELAHGRVWTSDGKVRTRPQQRRERRRGRFDKPQKGRRRKGCRERREGVTMTAGHLGIVVSFSPLCVCFGPATSRAAWGPSRLGHARRGRGKPGGKKKKKRLAGGTGCRPLPGSEWGLLQGQLGLRAWGPLWSSLCSALFSQRCPGVEDGDPGRAQSSSGHPPGHGLPGTSLHEKVSHLHQNVN